MMNNSDFVNIEVEYKKQGMWIKSVTHRLNSTISSMPLSQLKPGVRSITLMLVTDAGDELCW